MRLISTITILLIVSLFDYSAVAGDYTDHNAVTDSSERYIVEPIFGDSVYIFEAGLENDTTLILVHGVGNQAARIWKPLIPRLADKYRILTFDLPGFGRSAKDNALYSPEQYSKFIRWLADQYVDGPFMMMGHSLGGGVALCFAGMYPGQLEKLILIDACGILHRSVLTKYMVHIDVENQSKLVSKSLEIINDIISSTISGFEKIGLRKNINEVLNDPRLRKQVLRGNPTRIAGLALVQYDFSEIIDKIDVPVYIIWGSDDEITPLRTGKILDAKIPNARLKVIENADHVPFLDQPEAFRKVLMRGLSGSDHKSVKSDSMGSSHFTDEPVPLLQLTGKNDTTISGNYNIIYIRGCRNISLANVRAELIDISSSKVSIMNSKIAGGFLALNVGRSEVELEQCLITAAKQGLRSHSSEVKMTLVNILADTAIVTTRSRFDLAAVELHGRASAVASTGDLHSNLPNSSDLVFSVSYLSSPVFTGHVHGFRNVQPGKPL